MDIVEQFSVGSFDSVIRVFILAWEIHFYVTMHMEMMTIHMFTGTFYVCKKFL